MIALENQDKKLVGTAKLLSNTWKIYKEHYILIFGYVGWLLVPFVIHILVSITFSKDIIKISYFVTTIAEIILALWVSVLLISAVPILKRKKVRHLKKISTRSWKLIIPYFLTSIIFGFIVAAGITMLIIPGIIFYTWFLFAETVVVLEKSSIRKSFKTSKGLVKGRLLKILGQYLCGQIVIAFIFTIFIVLAYLALGPLQGVSFEMMLKAPPTLIGQAIEYILTLVFLPIIVIFETLLYLSAKESK